MKQPHQTPPVLTPALPDTMTRHEAECMASAAYDSGLSAQVADADALRSALETLLFIHDNVDETGYVTDVGFYHVDAEIDKARAALTTPAPASHKESDRYWPGVIHCIRLYLHKKHPEAVTDFDDMVATAKGFDAPAVRTGGWIPLAERKPTEEDDEVVYWSESEDYFERGDSMDDAAHFGYTHWLPNPRAFLPPFPKSRACAVCGILQKPSEQECPVCAHEKQPLPPEAPVPLHAYGPHGEPVFFKTPPDSPGTGEGDAYFANLREIRARVQNMTDEEVAKMEFDNDHSEPPANPGPEIPAGWVLVTDGPERFIPGAQYSNGASWEQAYTVGSVSGTVFGAFYIPGQQPVIIPAPAPDARAAFEAYAKTQCWSVARGSEMKGCPIGHEEVYFFPQTSFAWQGWQAGAAWRAGL